MTDCQKPGRMGRENCPNMKFFSGPYFRVFGLNSERYSVSEHFLRNILETIEEMFFQGQ